MREKLPRVGDKKWDWRTKQNKEVGEVLVVSGGRRFIVAAKDVMGREVGLEAGMKAKAYEVGIYELVEEKTGEVLQVGFEYVVENIKENGNG